MWCKEWNIKWTSSEYDSVGNIHIHGVQFSDNYLNSDMINNINLILLIYIIIFSMVCAIFWSWYASHFDIPNESVSEVTHKGWTMTSREKRLFALWWMVNMVSQLCRLDGNLSWIGSGRGELTFSYSVLSSYSVEWPLVILVRLGRTRNWPRAGERRSRKLREFEWWTCQQG